MANPVAKSGGKEWQLPYFVGSICNGIFATCAGGLANTYCWNAQHTQLRWQTHAYKVATTHVKIDDDTRVVWQRAVECFVSNTFYSSLVRFACNFLIIRV